jgi:hypothetical protein
MQLHAPANWCATILTATRLLLLASVRCQTIGPKSQTLFALHLYRCSIIVDCDCTIIAEMQDDILRA